MTITPADQAGYCLTTVHDFSSDATWTDNVFGDGERGYWLAVQPDGTIFVNIAEARNGYLTVDPPSGVVSLAPGAAWPNGEGSTDGLASDSAGNIYTCNDGTVAWDVARLAPDGTYTTPFVDLSGYGLAGFQDFKMGRDGNLYYMENSGASDDTGGRPNVLRIALDGTVTPIPELNRGSTLLPYQFPFYGSIAIASNGTIWLSVSYQSPPGYTSPNFGVNNTLIRAVPTGGTYTITEVPIQSLVDQSDDGNSEIVLGGIFCDADDNVIVPLVTFQVLFAPDLSWFLRVAPDGTATRIASTWSYTSTPLPAATTTNIADGPLNTSLCCELDNAVGISQDGKTVWFIDDGDQNNGTTGNLLRKLALCPATLTLTPRNTRLWRVGQP